MFQLNPVLKKILGGIFILAGLVALLVPFVPGWLLLFVGLELLGMRLIFWDKISAWLKSRI